MKTDVLRNRLMLELMARGGMRIGEVLKLTPSDVQDRKLIIRDPKSGREREFIFISQAVFWGNQRYGSDQVDRKHLRLKQVRVNVLQTFTLTS